MELLKVNWTSHWSISSYRCETELGKWILLKNLHTGYSHVRYTILAIDQVTIHLINVKI